MHFYGWKSGLKTGMYYLRTKAAVDAIKFTLDNTKKKEVPVSIAAEAEVSAATTEVAKELKVEATPVREQENETEPISPEEMKELISKAKEGQADDDCLMCGS